MMTGFYIITPYSPWSTKKTKQQELCERQDEEALLARLMCEAREQQNSNATAEAPTVGANFSDYKYFNPVMNVSLGATPLTADGPLTVTFVNNSDPSLIQYGSFVLTFGDNGFISSDPNTSYLYSNTGSYTASLTGTATYNGATATSTAYISASKPTISAGFTVVSSSKTAPSTFTFTNTSTNSSQTPSSTYLWSFGTASLTSTSVTPDVLSYTSAGPFTASLQLTGSYGLTSFVTRSWRLS